MNQTFSLPTQLELGRCPHCSVDTPSLTQVVNPFNTSTHDGSSLRQWSAYACRRCGGVVTAYVLKQYTGRNVDGYFPRTSGLSDDIPVRAKKYLQQAIDSKVAPSGSVMLCASAVDAMLKEKNYASGSLYSRIDKAVQDNVITPDMARWAHDVRLDANDERHADLVATMPELQDAERAIDFAEALAEILFVLPARVKRAVVVQEPAATPA